MTTTTSRFCRLAIDATEPVARIVLRHPPLNIIDVPMMDELVEALREIESLPEIAMVFLSADGGSFSAGVDVAAHTPDKVDAMLHKFHSVIRALITSRKVTVAAVHGNCLGGGTELAMVCDVVYTTTSARWGFPEINLGCYPPVACAALASLIGQKRAAELILTGKTITGSEAAAMGLANHAVDESELAIVVDRLAERLSRLSPAALAVTKKSLYAWDAMHFDKGLARAEKIYLNELMKTADAQEGVAAFMEKRQPRWFGARRGETKAAK